MPRTTRYSRLNWKRAFPSEALWCEAHPNTTISEQYAERGYLPATATTRLSRSLTDQASQHPNAPAEAWDVPTIPNGDYRVIHNDGTAEVFDYRVHLVTRGQLTGKRIIKFKGDDGIFRGFGFITKAGGFRLWSRFSESRDEDFVLFAEKMIATTFQRVDPGEYVLRIQDTFDYYDLSITPRCIQCNVQRVHHTSPAAFCHNHAFPPAVETEEDLDADVDYDVEEFTDVNGQTVRRPVRNPRVNPVTGRRRRTTVENYDADGPLLSELGTGDVI